MIKNHIVVWAITIWLIITLGAAYLYVQNQNTFPGAEGYEKDWTFQLAMFSMFRLPLLVVGLVAVLWLVWRWMKQP